MSDTSVSSATGARAPSPIADQNALQSGSAVGKGGNADQAPDARDPRAPGMSDSTTDLTPDTVFNWVDQRIREAQQKWKAYLSRDDTLCEIRARCEGNAKEYTPRDNQYVHKIFAQLRFVAQGDADKDFLTTAARVDVKKSQGWPQRLVKQERARLADEIYAMEVTLRDEFLKSLETPETPETS